MEKFELKKILVPTDFSETANNALRQAIYTARRAQAELKLMYVVTEELNIDNPIPFPETQVYYARLKDNLLKKLEKIAHEISKENSIKTTFEVRTGSVSKQICKAVEEEDFDLVMMGTHGTSGVSEFFAGSNASKVVANADCAVITLQHKHVGDGFKNIILPIRDDPKSRQKVDYVVKLAKLFGSTVYITGFTTETDKDAQDKVTQYVTQVEKYLTKLNVEHRSTLICAENFTKEMLAHAANHNADLIAIMNESSFSFDQLLKGPYAKQFVNHSTIPVMSVPVYSDPDLLVYTPYLSGELPG